MSTPGDRLRMARLHKGYRSAAEFARKADVSPITYRAHESGQNLFSGDQAKVYAKLLDVTAAWLMLGEGEAEPPDIEAAAASLRRRAAEMEAGPLRDEVLKELAEFERLKAAGQAFRRLEISEVAAIPNDLNYVMVRGAVEAGAWKEAVEWPEEDWYPVPAVPMPAYTHLPQFALEVRGPSMSRIYPDGSVLICVLLLHLGRDPKPGERVVVERRKRGFVEATVKEFAIESGVPKLYPRSDHPKHQNPISLPLAEHPPEDEVQDEEVRVTAVVIGSFRPEIIR